VIWLITSSSQPRAKKTRYMHASSTRAFHSEKAMPAGRVASRSLSKKSSEGKVDGRVARRRGSGGEEENAEEEEEVGARKAGVLGVRVGGMTGFGC